MEYGFKSEEWAKRLAGAASSAGWVEVSKCEIEYTYLFII